MSWLKLKKTFDPDKPLYCESYRKLNVDLYLKLYNIIKNIQNEWLALHSIAQIKKFNIDYNKNIKDKVNKKGSSKRFNGWNLFIQEKYKTAFDRDMIKLIECNASRQKWFDQSISFNLYNSIL